VKAPVWFDLAREYTGSAAADVVMDEDRRLGARLPDAVAIIA
jgi:hypothetical protein